MPEDRVSELLTAYFYHPYPDYGDVVLEIRNNGGLSAEEVQLVQTRVLLVDANAILRHSGTTWAKAIPASSA